MLIVCSAVVLNVTKTSSAFLELRLTCDVCKKGDYSIQKAFMHVTVIHYVRLLRIR